MYALTIRHRDLNISTSRHDKHRHTALCRKFRRLISHIANKKWLYRWVKETYQLVRDILQSDHTTLLKAIYNIGTLYHKSHIRRHKLL